MISIYLFIILTLTLVQAKNDLNQGERDLSFKKDKIARDTSVGGTIHGIFKEKEAQHVRHLAAAEGIQILDNNNQQVDTSNIPDNYKSNLQTLIRGIEISEPFLFHGLGFTQKREGSPIESYLNYWKNNLHGFLPMISSSVFVPLNDKPIGHQTATGVGILFHPDDTFIHVFSERDLGFRNPLGSKDLPDELGIWDPTAHRETESGDCDLEYKNRESEVKRIERLFSRDRARQAKMFLNQCYLGDEQDMNQTDELGTLDSDENKSKLQKAVDGDDVSAFNRDGYKRKLLEMLNRSKGTVHSEVVISAYTAKILVIVLLVDTDISNINVSDFIDWCHTQSVFLCVDLSKFDPKFEESKQIKIINQFNN